MVPKFDDDYYRYTGERWKAIKGTRILLQNHSLRFIYYLRQKEASKNKIKLILLSIVLHKMKLKYGLEFYDSKNIGGGLYIAHAFNIGINPATIIGKNFNIHKGATIGQENRGKRKGTPIIGDRVWVGMNATIAGNIRIGNNVLIAPNSFVNFDVPDNSIVIGSSAKIIPKSDATDGYMNKIIP